MPTIKGWKFPIEIDKTTGKISTIEDNENVKQDVRVILKTQKFERKTVPSFGTDLMSYMFEIVDPSFISMLKSTIENSLKTWEKHIQNINVTVTASRGPISEIFINIFYVTDIAPLQQEKLIHSMNTVGQNT